MSCSPPPNFPARSVVLFRFRRQRRPPAAPITVLLVINRRLVAFVALASALACKPDSASEASAAQAGSKSPNGDVAAKGEGGGQKGGKGGKGGAGRPQSSITLAATDV